MCSWMKPGLMLVIVNLAAPAMARAVGPKTSDPSPLSWRAGLMLGGAYTTNVYRNASAVSDKLALARLMLDASLNTSDRSLVKLLYRGDLDAYDELTHERVLGNFGELSLGLRAAELAYLTVAAGGESAHYPSYAARSFTGVFGGAGLRLELGEAYTVKTNYRLRREVFPSYDLDNTSHTGQLVGETMLGDHVELILPLTLRAAFYDERYLIAADGLPTLEQRRGFLWSAEPTVRVLPSYEVRLTGSLRVEWNDSRDSYYYTGPSEPSAPELINNFDSYWALASRLELSWELGARVVATARAVAGGRWYRARPAFDALGLPKSERERDLSIQGGPELEWRLTHSLSLALAYAFTRQFSNDYLWDFGAHRVDVTLRAALHD